ncbi:MAG TPA: hypothetical protein DHW02_06975 [Ktedonobacter sp.]|nr:hypothetical protein [Ktedonobacter sp.]
MLSNIYKSSKKYIFACMLLICMGLALVACSDASSGNGNGNAQGNKSGGNTQTVGTTSATQGGTTTVATPVSGTPGKTGTSGNGPIIILSPTPVPGGSTHSQQVALSDRTLIINNVTKSAGASASSVTITLSVEVKNTGSKAIMNQSDYYILTSSEGDSFGVTSSPTSSFYGSISASNSHSGTLVFQIPSAAATGLRLMYRPEVAADTTFLPLVL